MARRKARWSHGARTEYLFGLLATLLISGAYLWLNSRMAWHPYVVWLTTFSVATFGFYGLDKLLSKMPGTHPLRVPEVILHLLAALGGSLGAWLGTILLNHKSNWQKHPSFPRVLIASTLTHLALVYYWLLR